MTRKGNKYGSPDNGDYNIGVIMLADDPMDDAYLSPSSRKYIFNNMYRGRESVVITAPGFIIFPGGLVAITLGHTFQAAI